MPNISLASSFPDYMIAWRRGRMKKKWSNFENFACKAILLLLLLAFRHPTVMPENRDSCQLDFLHLSRLFIPPHSLPLTPVFGSLFQNPAGRIRKNWNLFPISSKARRIGKLYFHPSPALTFGSALAMYKYYRWLVSVVASLELLVLWCPMHHPSFHVFQKSMQDGTIHKDF